MNAAELASDRGRLMRLGYRMLGSWSDAEDIVQQSYERWYRLAPTEREQIENPAAWFTTVASRLCLNLLGSAPKRREHYVGMWLPEPVPSHAILPRGPLERVALDDSVSMALLVVLESLTPAERVCYILHEVFALPYAEIAKITGRTAAAARAAASAARRRLRDEHVRPVEAAEHTRLVNAFQDACERGDLDALISVLDPGVVSTSDGNGKLGVARRPVVGAENVARFLMGIIGRTEPGMEIERAEVNGTAGFALVRDGQVFGVVSLHVLSGKIRQIWFAMNPEKLSAWDAPSTASA